MNFLFTTVLVLLLVAPGLTFFRAYYAGKFSIRYSRLTITDQVFRSVIPGITAQLIAFWLIQALTDAYVRLDTLGVLLLGAREDKTVQAGFQLIARDLGRILCYHLAMITLGALAGWGLRELVRYRKWDRKFNWLRYDNPYHYLLTGEILETSDLKAVIQLEDASRIDFVFVDVLVKMEKNNLLYSGILVDYQLAGDGGLKSIYLRGAHRQYLNTQPPGEAAGNAGEPLSQPMNSHYDVGGHVLMLPQEQILNLNLTYWIDLQDARKEGDEPSLPADAIEISG